MTRVTMPAVDLRRVARAVAPAASRDDARQILTAVLFEVTPETVRFAATDSYRLHVATFRREHLGAVVGTCRVMIPGEFLARWGKSPIAKGSDAQIRVVGKSVVITTETWSGTERMQTRLIPPMRTHGHDMTESTERGYPNIDSLIPDDDEPVVGASAFNETYFGAVFTAAKAWRGAGYEPLQVLRLDKLRTAKFRVDVKGSGTLTMIVMPVRCEGVTV